MKTIIILCTFYILVHGTILQYNIKPSLFNPSNSKHINIQILDSKELFYDEYKGIKVTELSALAYKNNILYALSDSGYLYHFDLKIKDGEIKKCDLKKAFKLKNKKNKELKRSKRDSEGMVVLDNTLLISFEQEPRVEEYSLDGVKIKKHKLHKKLKDADNYQNKNKALESVAYSETYGVITAPEVPLKIENKKFHTLYAKDKTLRFKASGSITALEFISTHELLVLQRSFNKKTLEAVVYLNKVNLGECNKKLCNSYELAKFDSNDGWKIDNFEGLTKVGKNRFLMVSDNNDNKNQKTLLVLFEI